MPASPDICPFGEGLQKYWDKRYQYFSRFDEGIQIDEEGLYSVIPEETGLQQARLIKGTTVYDGFCGVGGNTIAFARAGKKVISSDTSAERLEMARNNAQVYGVDELIEFQVGNFVDLVKTIKADAVYLDPPWGGPAYRELGRFLLEYFNPDGNELLKLSLQHFNEVVIRVPTIFDTSELDRYAATFDVVDDVSNGRVISRSIVLRKKQ